MDATRLDETAAGMYVISATPFTAQGALDLASTRSLMSFYLDRGVTGITILGMMGERILAAVRRREVPPMDPSILKLFVAENRVQAGNLAMEISGARGAASEAGDELAAWVRSELLIRFAVSIGGGTNEVQRNNLAERALGLPKELRNDHQIPWKDVPRG